MEQKKTILRILSRNIETVSGNSENKDDRVTLKSMLTRKGTIRKVGLEATCDIEQNNKLHKFRKKIF